MSVLKRTEPTGSVRPFYVIRVAHEDGVTFWKSPSCPASPSLGEATVFRSAGAAADVKQTAQTWTTGVVEVVAVNLESLMKEY